MKYVLLFTGPSDDSWETMPPEELGSIMGAIGEWWGQHAATGAITGGERLAPAVSSTSFKTPDGSTIETIDGPFIEAKEEVSGFAIVEVADLDAALALARTWPALRKPGEGVEVRPVFEM